MKTGLVLEGGGMRGLYAAGVLDVMMEHQFMPDVVCGVPVFARSPSRRNGLAKKNLLRSFSLPPFLLSPKIKNFRGPHCLVELSLEPNRKSNSPIVVILN